MLVTRTYEGAAAVARFLIGIVLEVLSSWLILVNVLLSAIGMVAALSDGVGVTWDGIFPVLAGGSTIGLSQAAGVMLGLLTSIVEVLVWRGDIDLDRASFKSRSMIWSIIIYDITSTIWGLTSGQFYDPANATASVVRLSMAVALTLFAFSIGAERWGVMGFQLISANWYEALTTMQIIPRRKIKGGGDQQRKHEGFQGPPPGMALMDPEELKRIRDERSRQNNPQDNGSNKQRRQAEERNRQAQEQFRKGNRG